MTYQSSDKNIFNFYIFSPCGRMLPEKSVAILASPSYIVMFKNEVEIIYIYIYIHRTNPKPPACWHFKRCTLPIISLFISIHLILLLFHKVIYQIQAEGIQTCRVTWRRRGGSLENYFFVETYEPRYCVSPASVQLKI